MADTGALSRIAAHYAQRHGRATCAALALLAARYGRAAGAVAPQATAEGGADAEPESPVLILARMRSGVSALNEATRAVAAHCRDATPPPLAEARPRAAALDDTAEWAALADSAEWSALADDAAVMHSERGQLPMSAWIKEKARKDMVAMSEPDLRRHVDDLARILGEGWITPPDAGLSGRQAHAAESEYRLLRNEVEASLHIGWLLEDEFSGPSPHAESESALLARMTPFERGQYEVRKENASRRQEFRRRRPEVFSPAGLRAGPAAGEVRGGPDERALPLAASPGQPPP